MISMALCTPGPSSPANMAFSSEVRYILPLFTGG
jgi:hypothetical protein